MLSKFKNWHSGLSSAGKVLVWFLAITFSVAAVDAATPDQPKSNTSNTVQQASVEKKTITEATDVPFSKTTIEDSNLDQGKTELRTTGVNGVKTFTYEISYENGVEKDRVLQKEEITKQPTNEVTAVGTKKATPPPAPPTRRSAPSNCDPNYSGCVPVASDVDCAGGSGNGPAYVSGPIRVVGSDIYDLDRDGNGIACE